jgi:hypothetical protein
VSAPEKKLMHISRILIGCLLVPAFAYGQEAVREYIFIAPARATNPKVPSNTGFGVLPPAQTATANTSGSSAAYGGGFGVVLRLSHDAGMMQHFGAGIDLSAILPSKGKVGSNTVGSLGLNGYYHPFANTTFDPYATGGYSAVFRDFAANGYNFGGGVNCWFGDTSGLMVEIRQLMFQSSPNLFANHFTEFRFGYVHRSK